MRRCFAGLAGLTAVGMTVVGLIPAGTTAADTTAAGTTAADAAPSCEYPAIAAPPPQLAPAPCRRPSEAVTKVIDAAVVAAFVPVHDGGSADINYACDGIGDGIAEVVVETGNGHGGTLGLWRARRNADGRFAVVGIEVREAGLGVHAENPPFEVASGTVDLPDLELVRAGVDARITEMDPPPPPDSVGGFTQSFSSNDFHLLIRLVDDDGRVVERRFTGYESNGRQTEYLGLLAGRPGLEPMLSRAMAHAAVTDDVRALFASRFVAMAPRLDDEDEWYVKERIVELSRYAGSPAVIPGLLGRLQTTRPTFRPYVRSYLATRASAVAGIAAITGWDARRETRSIDEAAARDLAVCHAR